MGVTSLGLTKSEQIYCQNFDIQWIHYQLQEKKPCSTQQFPNFRPFWNI
jgi:hypothetical protein